MSFEYVTESGPTVGTLESFIQQTLRSTHLGSEVDLRFRSVPSEAPELHDVMDEFAHIMSGEDEELYNGWGAVIISDNQEDLIRMDVLVIWQEVLLDGGKVVLDENGNVIPLFNEDGSPKMRIAEDHLFIHRNAAYFMN